MLAPIPMIGAVAAFLLIIDLAAVQLLSSMPHPDHDFRLIDGHVYIVSGEEQHELLSITGGGSTIQLLPVDLNEDPDVLSNRSELDEFFERQHKIYLILNARDPVANTTTGRVELDRRVELLPGNITFWLQLLVGNVGMLLGVAVWTFQRANLAARHLAVTGVGLAISAISAAIYSSRSVAIDGAIFEFLSYVNFSGVLVFSAGFLCMMWNYPKPLANIVIAPYWYGLMGLVFCADLFGWVESLDLTRRMPAVFTLLGAGFIIALQWRKSRSDPLTRQSLYWFVFVTLSGSTFFILAIMLPPLFDRDIVVPQGVAFLAFLTIYVGLAVGVARYPLFDLQQYWVKSLIWLLGGLVVIGLNLAIASSFGLSNTTVLLMIAASIAAIVLPLRALGTRYVLNSASKNFQSHLPQIVARMSGAVGNNLESIWSIELEEIFQPLEMKKERVRVMMPVVAKRGLGLVVPSMGEAASYHLTYADKGTRLFNSLDVTLLETLISLFEMSRSRQEVEEGARQEERGRLKRDLHDTLGGRLLTIMQTAADESTANESRQAMAELREILTAVDGGVAPLNEALATWHDQLIQQAGSFEAGLEWHVSEALLGQNRIVPGKARFHLGRILRELLTNAVRHAAARRVLVELTEDGGHLVVKFSNDGDVGEADAWQVGNGLTNLLSRAEELDGEIVWRTVEGRARFDLRVPLAGWQ